MLTLGLPVRCISKQRPRAYIRAGKVAHYMNADYMKWKSDVAARLREMYAGPPFEGPLSLSIIAYYRLAPKGDVDNLAGALMDAANGILWHDDGQILRLCVERLNNTGRDGISLLIKEYKYEVKE